MAEIVLISVTTVIFGIASLLLISRARGRLSEGSIRKYLDNFAICLAFMVIFSIWQTMRTILGIDINVAGLGTYPEYIFIVFAYLAFIVASFRVLRISHEFGFKEEGKKIEDIIEERVSKIMQEEDLEEKEKDIQKKTAKPPRPKRKARK